MLGRRGSCRVGYARLDGGLLFLDDLAAQVHALVADVDPARPGDQALHLILALAAEGAAVRHARPLRIRHVALPSPRLSSASPRRPHMFFAMIRPVAPRLAPQLTGWPRWPGCHTDDDGWRVCHTLRSWALLSVTRSATLCDSVRVCTSPRGSLARFACPADQQPTDGRGGLCWQGAHLSYSIYVECAGQEQDSSNSRRVRSRSALALAVSDQRKQPSGGALLLRLRLVRSLVPVQPHRWPCRGLALCRLGARCSRTPRLGRQMSPLLLATVDLVAFGADDAEAGAVTSSCSAVSAAARAAAAALASALAACAASSASASSAWSATSAWSARGRPLALGGDLHHAVERLVAAQPCDDRALLAGGQRIPSLAATAQRGHHLIPLRALVVIHRDLLGVGEGSQRQVALDPLGGLRLASPRDRLPGSYWSRRGTARGLGGCLPACAASRGPSCPLSSSTSSGWMLYVVASVSAFVTASRNSRLASRCRCACKLLADGGAHPVHVAYSPMDMANSSFSSGNSCSLTAFRSPRRWLLCRRIRGCRSPRGWWW